MTGLGTFNFPETQAFVATSLAAPCLVYNLDVLPSRGSRYRTIFVAPLSVEPGMFFANIHCNILWADIDE